MEIRDWQDKIKAWGKEKGWDEIIVAPEQLGTKLFLIAGELVEAFEEIRNGHAPHTVYHSFDESNIAKPEGFGIEMADALIRLLHLMALMQLDAEELMAHKMEYNQERPYRHGNKTI